MKSRVLFLLLFLLSTALLMGNLPTCYHTYDQIIALMNQYETEYPNQAKVHLLGYSQEEQIPIYAIKLSNNVLQDEDQPSLLFVGQVHAEEVLGVEITLSNIKEILLNRNQSPYNVWLSQLELWFVPTLNPEGHNVVTSNIDTSYRKNKRDNNGNGIFDFSPLVGYDIDGVDINRNFGYNWVHGDSLMQPGGLEYYDYYRGPEPMSESEVQAIKVLSDNQKFTYSIVWHSSRTGNLSEKIYYSFNWKEVRPSPDVDLAYSVALGVANQITNESGSASYEALPNLGRKGNFHDWMYQQYGSIQLLIEVGTSNLQPDSLLMVNTIQRATNGVRWLINRALPFSTAVPSSSLLTGLIKDAVTNEPLEAEVIIEEKHAPWFIPRTSKASTGRYYRPITPGTYTLRVRKQGYYDYVLPNLVVNNSSMTQRHISLSPKPAAVLSGTVSSEGQPISAKIILYDIEPSVLNVNGDFVLNTFVAQDIKIEVSADGYFPYIGTLDLHAGVNNVFVDLSPTTTIFSEDWENGTEQWTITGPWVLQSDLSASGAAITDSWGGNGFYAENCDVNIQSVSPIFIPSSTPVYLIFDSHLYTEWDFDPATIEISTDQTNWDEIWRKSGQHDFWQREYVPLGEYAGMTLYFRFRLTDQSTHAELTDPGWTIDNIHIVSGIATSNSDHVSGIQIPSALYPNYPNPFNPSTTIRYALADRTELNLSIYNLKGQLVKTLISGNISAGNHSITWNGLDESGQRVASGIYYYRLQTPSYAKTMKMVLMK